jgi:hypothetical protein
MHWRTFLDSEVIRYVDLDGREYTLQIKAVKKGKVTGSGGKASGKAIISFEGREKPLGAGAEVLAQIATLYGNDTRQWPGKWITIYPEPSVKYGGAKVGGVRVRPIVPEAPQPAPGKPEEKR